MQEFLNRISVTVVIVFVAASVVSYVSGNKPNAIYLLVAALFVEEANYDL